MKPTKIFFVALIFILFIGGVNAQEWLWTADISCTQNSQTNVFKSDNNGDLLMFMVYEGDITIGGRTMSSIGSKDILLSKFTPDGDTLWNKPIGSTGSDSPRRLVVNDANEIFITGGFAGPCNFDAIVLNNTYASEDIFLTKYAPNGSVIWARSIAWGPDQDRSSGILLDDGGNIALVGFFRDSIFFEHDTLVSSGGIDNFFAKYDGDGNFIRAIHYPGNNNQTRFNEISLSNDNAYLLSGFYSGTFTAQTESIVSAGSNDIFLIKSDTAGSELWIRTAGGTSADRGFNASSDQYGNVYLAGYVASTATFDSLGFGLRESSPLVSAGNTDMFLAKYNKNGTLQWKTNNGSISLDQGYGVHAYNNIVQFTGFITGTVIFGTDTLTSKNNSSDAGFFIYNTDGASIKGVLIEGSLDDQGADVVYDEAGNSYLAGFFSSDTLYLGDKQIVKQATGATNPYLAKYSIPFSASFTEIKPIACNSEGNGGLTVTPYFGAEPFVYNWSHDAGLNDSVASNLGAGTYSVTITDSRDSTAFTIITLNEPDPIDIAAISTDVSCHPDNGPSGDGSIDLTVSGGTAAGAYSYTWEAISGSGVNATSEDQPSLTRGEYSVTVTDDILCWEDDTFLIAQPDSIYFSGTLVTDATGGTNGGAIDLNPAGGNGTPYTFEWSTLETTEDINSLFAGNYSVTVTDGALCQGDTTFLVLDLTAFLAFIIDKEDVDCFGNSTGSATVGTTGGTGPSYTYAWRTSGGTPVGSSLPTLSNVEANTYIVRVTDNFDARFSEVSFDINEPTQALTSSVAPTDLKCYGNSSGVGDLSVSGGTLPYAFLWSNGATTEDIVNVPALSYSVTVTDKNDCISLGATDIDEPDAMDINISIDQVINCFGELTGRLTATALGGVGTKTYLWDDPGNQTEQIATNLGAGYYSVTATDLNLCNVVDNIQLDQPPELLVSLAPQNITCFGAGDGSINLSRTGGTPTFSYDWSNGEFIDDISGLSAGVYSVTVTDAFDCNSISEAEITEPEEVLIQNITATDVSCAGYTDGQISITGQGGEGIYQYSIDDGTSYSADSSFTDLEAGTYLVVIIDENDCGSVSTEAIINEPDGTTISTEEATNISCFGSTDGSITIVATSNAGTLEYSVDTGTSYLENNGVFENLVEGNYQILIRDINGCIITSSELEIVEPEVIIVDTTITHAEGEEDGGILADASGGTTPYAYYLLAGDETTDNLDGDFQGLVPGDYSVYVLDANLCISDTIYATISHAVIPPGTDLIIYNAFSPNADGVNDTWTIDNIGQYTNCTVTVLNTWGNKVLTSDGYTEPWDGTYNDNELPAGTYYYIIDLGDGSETLTGPVSIVR